MSLHMLETYDDQNEVDVSKSSPSIPSEPERPIRVNVGFSYIVETPSRYQALSCREPASCIHPNPFHTSSDNLLRHAFDDDQPE